MALRRKSFEEWATSLKFVFWFEVTNAPHIPTYNLGMPWLKTTGLKPRVGKELYQMLGESESHQYLN